MYITSIITISKGVLNQLYYDFRVPYTNNKIK